MEITFNFIDKLKRRWILVPVEIKNIIVKAIVIATIICLFMFGVAALAGGWAGMLKVFLFMLSLLISAILITTIVYLLHKLFDKIDEKY